MKLSSKLLPNWCESALFSLRPLNCCITQPVGVTSTSGQQGVPRQGPSDKRNGRCCSEATPCGGSHRSCLQFRFERPRPVHFRCDNAGTHLDRHDPRALIYATHNSMQLARRRSGQYVDATATTGSIETGPFHSTNGSEWKRVIPRSIPASIHIFKAAKPGLEPQKSIGLHSIRASAPQPAPASVCAVRASVRADLCMF